MKQREETQQKQLLAQVQEQRDLIEQENDKNRLKEGERDSVASDSDVESDSESDQEEEAEGAKDKHIDKSNDIPIVRNLKMVTQDPEEQDMESDDGNYTLAN